MCVYYIYRKISDWDLLTGSQRITKRPPASCCARNATSLLQFVSCLMLHFKRSRNYWVLLHCKSWESCQILDFAFAKKAEPQPSRASQVQWSVKTMPPCHDRDGWHPQRTYFSHLVSSVHSKRTIYDIWVIRNIQKYIATYIILLVSLATDFP